MAGKLFLATGELGISNHICIVCVNGDAWAMGTARTVSQLRDLLRQKLSDVKKGAQVANLVEKQAELSASFGGRSVIAAGPTSLLHISQVAKFDVGDAKKTWAAILYLDLRNSSKIAEQESEKKFFLLIHGLLYLLAEVVIDHGGIIVGFRGDGLFAAFGLDSEGNCANTTEATSAAVSSALECGKALLEAIDKVLVPELEETFAREMPNDKECPPITIGVGIDANFVVLTRIGLIDSNELTAYGPPVNHSSKLADAAVGEVFVTEGFWKFVETTKDGRLKIGRRFPVGSIHNVLSVEYPTDLKYLKD